MALVTVQRSPSSSPSSHSHDSSPTFQDEMDISRKPKSLSECYFAGKGTALVLSDASGGGVAGNGGGGGLAHKARTTTGDNNIHHHHHHHHHQQFTSEGGGVSNNCCIGSGGGGGGGVVVGGNSSSTAIASGVGQLPTFGGGCATVTNVNANNGCCTIQPCTGANGGSSNIQRHLQSMFYLLRPEETLKMAVKLESVHLSRTRYLVVVSRMGSRSEESCLLGIDCNEKTTVGLVLRVLANTQITLDGDGGFSVAVCDRHHIFKPVSVQAMWSALQTLHKVSAKAREQNYFQGGTTHTWVEYYEDRIESERSCLNEWHAMDNLESKRPLSPDSVRIKPTEREETEKVIRTTLKEIMMSVDLDEVTSKVIRSRLEEELDMDLGEYKSFIDQEMLIILGQMDAPTEIFDHVYLGSEWNASNYEELQRNGVGHILNVTREIDNFFPGTFDYLNIRVYDDEKTDLLKHWDDTFKYITKAKDNGSKVLVHCKMGVSRSASVVIAYAMKAFNWDFNTALRHVKEKRNCIKPNNSFLLQLETYQGILDAMKNKEKLQRSKSETNLKSPGSLSTLSTSTSKTTTTATAVSSSSEKNEKVVIIVDNSSIRSNETTAADVVQAMSKSYDMENHHHHSSIMSLRHNTMMGTRPKSWSPENLDTREMSKALKSSPVFISLEDISQKSSTSTSSSSSSSSSMKESMKNIHNHHHLSSLESTSSSSLARHVLMPCDNGESYSVSPNQIVHLPGHDVHPIGVGGVGTVMRSKKSSIVLDLATQFEKIKANSNKDTSDAIISENKNEDDVEHLKDDDTWDPGEDNDNATSTSTRKKSEQVCDLDTTTKNDIVSATNKVWTSTTTLKCESAVPIFNNNNNNCSSDSVSSSSSDRLVKVPDDYNEDSSSSTTTKATVTLRKDCFDPFSNRLDRVFDREEKRQQRMSTIPIISSSSSTIITEPILIEEKVIAAAAPPIIARECPSRQSSWSSYDSAVVLGGGGGGGTELSRHSSWGSGDTTATTCSSRTLPSRNSSWGSYDMRRSRRRALPVHVNEKGESIHSECSSSSNSSNSSCGIFPYDKEDIPWYPGTVQRSKQKIEERSSGKRSSASLTSSYDDASSLLVKTPSSETLLFDLPIAAATAAEAINTALIEAATLKTTTNIDNDRKKPSSAISAQIDIPKKDGIGKQRRVLPSVPLSRLSISAPERSSMELLGGGGNKNVGRGKLSLSASNVSSKSLLDKVVSVKQHRTFLENLQSNMNAQQKTDEKQQQQVDSSGGKVMNLKKEFEAKSGIEQQQLLESDTVAIKLNKPKVNSLPSSPVSVHQPKVNNNNNSEAVTTKQQQNEDTNLKNLIGIFESQRDTLLKPSQQQVVGVQRRHTQKYLKTTLSSPNKTNRYSCIEMSTTSPSSFDRKNAHNNITTMDGGDRDPMKKPRRPPIVPVVRTAASAAGAASTPAGLMVAATVITAANNKKKQQQQQLQYGKSHPLARLNIKPRHNNPVYNTM